MCNSVLPVLLAEMSMVLSLITLTITMLQTENITCGELEFLNFESASNV